MVGGAVALDPGEKASRRVGMHDSEVDPELGDTDLSQHVPTAMAKTARDGGLEIAVIGVTSTHGVNQR